MPELLHIFMKIADWLVYFARSLTFIAMTPISEIFSGNVGFSFLPVFTDTVFPPVMLLHNWFLDGTLDTIQLLVGLDNPLTVLEFTLYLTVVTFVIVSVRTVVKRVAK